MPRVPTPADDSACLTVSHKPADRPLLRKGDDVPKRVRIRYALTSHMNLYLPRFKSAADDSVFCQATASFTLCSAVTTLPGAERAGRFRVQAKLGSLRDVPTGVAHLASIFWAR